MDQISKEGGRTILFVSHQMQVVQKLCNVGLFLQKGKLIESATIDTVVNRYLQNNEEAKAEFELPKPAELTFGYAYKCMIEDMKGNAIRERPVGSAWRVRVRFKLEKNTEHFIMGCGIVSSMDISIRTSWSKPQDLNAGEYEMLFENSDVFLTSGNYKIVIGLSSNQRAFQYCDNTVHISISDAGDTAYNERIVNTQSGLILNPMPVELIKC
jgi:lipopolysaccharide transport system ATP-binding protein